MTRDVYYKSARQAIGWKEEQLHAYTGLRSDPYRVRLIQAPTCIMAGQPIVDAIDWTVLPLNSEFRTRANTSTSLTPVAAPMRLPVPCTPCFTFVNSTATPDYGQLIRLRIKGYDQYGGGQTEVTPWLTIPTNASGSSQGQATYIWISKVFAIISEIAYQADNTSGNDNLSCGTKFLFDADHFLATDGEQIYNEGTAATSHIRNMGIGLPLRTRHGHVNPATHEIEDSSGLLDFLCCQAQNLTTGQVYNVQQHRAGTETGSGAFIAGWTVGEYALSTTQRQWQGGFEKLGLYTATTASAATTQNQPFSAVQPTSVSEVHAIAGLSASGAQTVIDVTGDLISLSKYPAGTGRPFNVVVEGTSTAADGQWICISATTAIMITENFSGTPPTAGAGGTVSLMAPAELPVSAALDPDDVFELAIWLRSTLGQPSKQKSSRRRLEDMRPAYD